MKLQANSLKIIITFTAQQFNSAVRARFIFFMQAINVSADSLWWEAEGGGGGGVERKTEVKHLDNTSRCERVTLVLLFVAAVALQKVLQALHEGLELQRYV